MDLLKEIIVYLRSLQMFYHAAHNSVKGKTFFSDHDAFGAFYPEVEGHYDSVVERLIGLHGCEAFNNKTILKAVSAVLEHQPGSESSIETKFKYALQVEEKICEVCESVDKSSASSGTRQLIGNIADMSEARQYKIKQRME